MKLTTNATATTVAERRTTVTPPRTRETLRTGQPDLEPEEEPRPIATASVTPRGVE